MPSASASSTSSSKPNSSTPALAVSLSIIGALVIVAIIITIIRFRRRPAEAKPRHIDPDSSLSDTNRSRLLSPTHPASRITPFGSTAGESPRFVHKPGSNMRIANRRDDGVWTFDDPRGSFSPAGVSDLDLVPSRAPSTKRKKEEYGRGMAPTPPPPPAYSHEDGRQYLPG